MILIVEPVSDMVGNVWWVLMEVMELENCSVYF